MSEKCVICSRPVEVEFHSIFFDGLLKAGICSLCFMLGDQAVIKGVVKARWKRVLGILGLTHEGMMGLAGETKRLPEELRQPVLIFLQLGDEEVLSGVEGHDAP